MSKSKGLAAVALIVATSGCMTYRGPRGVEDALEHKLGVELHRDVGIKLGPLSTKFALSFMDDDNDDMDLHDLTGIAFAVYEVGEKNGRTPTHVEPKDLGCASWSTLFSSQSADDHVLLLVKPRNGSIHDMMLLAADDDEVVVARLKGRLDKLIAKAIDQAKHDGAKGARAALGSEASVAEHGR